MIIIIIITPYSSYLLITPHASIGKKKLPLVPFNVDVAITEYATGKVGPDSSLPMLLIEVDDAIRGVNNDEYIDR